MTRRALLKGPGSRKARLSNVHFSHPQTQQSKDSIHQEESTTQLFVSGMSSVAPESAEELPNAAALAAESSVEQCWVGRIVADECNYCGCRIEPIDSIGSRSPPPFSAPLSFQARTPSVAQANGVSQSSPAGNGAGILVPPLGRRILALTTVPL